MTGGKRRQMRAADADRDQVASVLGTAYSEGRLSKDEYDARLEAALAARTYADLDQVVTDLPGQAAMDGPVAEPALAAPGQGAGLAIAGLVLGWGAVILGVIVAVIVIVAGTHGMGGMQMP
jgi:hypothetical protein